MGKAISSLKELMNGEDPKNRQDTLTYHLKVYERFLIMDALRRTNGNCVKAAQTLGTSRRVFFYKVKKHEIDYRQFRRKKTDERGPAMKGLTKPNKMESI